LVFGCVVARLFSGTCVAIPLASQAFCVRSVYYWKVYGIAFVEYPGNSPGIAGFGGIAREYVALFCGIA